MFESNLLERYISPIGFSLKVNNIEKETDFWIYSATITGRTHTGSPIVSTVEFSIPAPHGRVFNIEGNSGTRTRIICHNAFYDIFDANNVIPKNLTVKRWQYVYLNAINNCFIEACFDWKYGGELPSGDLITQKIEQWLNTSPVVMDVKVDTPLQQSSVEDIVILDIAERDMDFSQRIFPKELLYKLDPCSTSTSNKINLVYRLAKGAKIVNGSIENGETTFCKTIADNAIVALLNPRRAYLLRTTFENSVKLVNPEKPLVANPNNQLHGANLLTAIMHLEEHTFEDCIAISQSAAKKLDCYVEKSVTVRSQSPIEVLVKNGEVVNPGQLIAKTETQEFKFTKLNYPMCVIDVQTSRRLLYGKTFNVVTFKMCSVYMLKDGDKLSNRGAIKGVIKIIPDSKMPITESGKVVEVCIAPESIYKRRCMAIYWEMMANKAIANNEVVEFDFYNAKTTFGELATKYGNSEQLYLGLDKLPNLTFTGTIFWLRLNKHSVDMLSIKNDDLVLNQYGLKVDDPSASGQRRDFAKALALISRDLKPVLDQTIDKTGVKVLTDSLNAIFGDKS